MSLVYWYYNSGNNPFAKAAQKERMVRVYAESNYADQIIKSGQVAVLNMGVENEDPYFRLEREVGYTRKAKRYGDVRRKMTDAYPKLENSLTSIGSKLKPYGEYIYIDLAYIDSYINPLLNQGIFHSKHFIKKSKFTIETLLTIVNYHPYALSGDEIQSYQKTEIPALLLALKIEFPEIYEELKSQSPRVMELDEQLTYKNKTAYLSTLQPGYVELELGVINSQTFMWDGITLTNTIKAYDGMEIHQSVTPSEKTTVKVLDDATVTSQTQFVD